jgi:hypothetical protein
MRSSPRSRWVRGSNDPRQPWAKMADKGDHPEALVCRGVGKGDRPQAHHQRLSSWLCPEYGASSCTLAVAKWRRGYNRATPLAEARRG